MSTNQTLFDRLFNLPSDADEYHIINHGNTIVYLDPQSNWDWSAYDKDGFAFLGYGVCSLANWLEKEGYTVEQLSINQIKYM